MIYKLKQNGISGKILNIIKDFLDSRKQRVVLNGQYSSWVNITARVPQGSILGSLFFVIYINDLSKTLSSNHKLLADDMSLFSLVHNLNTSLNNLNKDLKKINDWTTQWKMKINPDPTKPAQEVIFPYKIKKPLDTPFNFNNINVKQTAFQNHLALILDSQLTFEEHLKTIFRKVYKNPETEKFLTKTIFNDSLQIFYSTSS